MTMMMIVAMTMTTMMTTMTHPLLPFLLLFPPLVAVAATGLATVRMAALLFFFEKFVLMEQMIDHGGDVIMTHVDPP